MKTTITNHTNIGTMTYPFLSRFEQWAIESHPIKKDEGSGIYSLDQYEEIIVNKGYFSNSSLELKIDLTLKIR